MLASNAVATNAQSTTKSAAAKMLVPAESRVQRSTTKPESVLMTVGRNNRRTPPRECIALRSSVGQHDEEHHVACDKKAFGMNLSAEGLRDAEDDATHQRSRQ